MFVSTNALSLMEAIAGRRLRPPELESLAQPGDGPALGGVVRLVPSDQLFQTVCEQAAYRRAFLRGKDTSFPEELGIDAQGDVRPGHEIQCNTVLRDPENARKE